MNHEWENITLDGAKNFEQLTASELKELLKQSPYSFFHQFLYTKKIKESNGAEYKKQASKTALFTNNLPWLEYILDDTDKIQEISTPHAVMESNSSMKETIEENIIDETKSISNREINIAAVVAEDNPLIKEVMDEKIIDEIEPLTIQKINTADVVAEDNPPIKEVMDEKIIDEIEPLSNQQINTPDTVTESNLLTDESIEETIIDETKSLSNHEVNTTHIVAEETLSTEEAIEENKIDKIEALTKEEINRANVAAGDTTLTEEVIDEIESLSNRKINTAYIVAEETLSMEEAIEAERELYVEHETSEEAGSLVSGILDREKEIAAQENELKFEPLHTVDYFASQGIKTPIEQFPPDKLGKQLKSFTEWLKTMKRLPVEESANINEKDAQQIQTDAEDSNEIREVTTEAMAEVLLKQGKTEKAISIYHKLSLLYPEKSPYFAAKIEQLKA